MLAIRRIKAFAVDYLLIAVYVCLLTFVSFGLGAAEQEMSTDPIAKARLHAIAFFTLTLPVIVYFSICERFWQQTLGKRLCSLVVENRDAHAISTGQAFGRNILKFLPWEIAHTAIWYGSPRPFIDPMSSLGLGASSVAILLAVVLVASLWLPGGRAIHDRIAGTRVLLTRM